MALKADYDSRRTEDENEKEKTEGKYKEGSIACVDKSRDMSLQKKIDDLILQMGKSGSKSLDN